MHNILKIVLWIIIVWKIHKCSHTIRINILKITIGKDFIAGGCTLISSYRLIQPAAQHTIRWGPWSYLVSSSSTRFPHTRGSPWRTTEGPWAIVRGCGTPTRARGRGVPTRERDRGIPTRERGGDPGAREVGGLPWWSSGLGLPPIPSIP
jgi:hypothetical protein